MEPIKSNALFMIFAVLIIVLGFFYLLKEPEKEITAKEIPEEIITVEEIIEEGVVEEEVIEEEITEEVIEEEKPKEVVIEIKWKSFEPTGYITVEKGTTVTWKNKDIESPTRTHMISAKHWAFRSEKLYEGDSFSYIFNDLGVYDYIDVLYGITGRITVVKKEKMPLTGSVIADIDDKASSLVMVLLVVIIVCLCFEIYRKKSAWSYGK